MTPKAAMIRGRKGVIAPVLRMVRSNIARAKLSTISVKLKTRYSHLSKVGVTLREIAYHLFVVRCILKLKLMQKKGSFAGDISSSKRNSDYRHFFTVMGIFSGDYLRFLK
jgi:hypothetical protein